MSHQVKLPALGPDPLETDPDLYHLLFENDEVRVIEYRDEPGDRTTPHQHPGSVMYTLSSFRRRLHTEGTARDVELSAGTVHWLPPQIHAGENIGDTPTHVLFVEIKRASAGTPDVLGPA